jgi:long-chain acyl-CoA synthetase
MSIPAQRFEYLRDPAKTASSRQGDFFTLGDIGHLDEDGWLFLRDRAADVIVAAGVNIYPAEVEAVLAEHDAVADAAVIGAPDPERGERVVAFVQTAPGVTATPALAGELMAWCRTQIAAFKAPREIEFRDALPRSDVGKLLRRVLREERWAHLTERL